MTFRTRLLIAFTLMVVFAVAVVAWAVSATTRRAFEQLDAQRTQALVAQFQQEFARRGAEIVRRVDGVAETEATQRMALKLNLPDADVSLYVNDATGISRTHQLDFVEIDNHDGAIISSAQWPARFGYKNDWVTQPVDWKARGAFLRKEELPDGFALALVAVRPVAVGERRIYIIGGQRLDKEFLASLVLPEGMRALLYRNLEQNFVGALLTDANGPLPQSDMVAPLIEDVRRLPRDLAGQPRELVQTIQWSRDPASAESVHAIPLLGPARELLGVLLVASSRREIVALGSFIRSTAFLVAAGGILLGFLLSWWASARITSPVQQLVAGAREVASGNWHARVDVPAGGEIAELARAFNHMTLQLATQREQLVQSERVAAWRELARRLAHELKNPLFPLQITVENLQRARQHSPGEFDEVFRESTNTLLAELSNLKTIVGRFSDFAKMPAPDLKTVNMNDVVRDALRPFYAQFTALGRPSITPELYLEEDIPSIEADPDLLHRAVQNLVLNALDAMPAGGTLTIRTRPGAAGGVLFEIADTGAGLTREECERLFTPYYTTKQYGTGLGLAIVQSVVSDHTAKISVESESGHGTTFRIEFPSRPVPLCGTGLAASVAHSPEIISQDASEIMKAKSEVV
ncbi:MAG: HAMP domain-containing protein [Acidobacteria bacterium]|nr:HAMP domain-containing protein [Acidobacteriota bacterium]